ncbi:MAG: hypothetical protein JSS60_05220 [Verrucomicrobia bacterium]|nr:hypothetical protein [Verrucomicrobiota bacterium]
MKIISSILMTLGTGVVLMSASVSPVATEKKDTNLSTAQAVKAQPVVAPQTSSLNSAIRVIAPQKDLESAIRNSEQGDILLLGQDGWYRLEGKALQQGTKMYVLGGQGSMVSAFPKEADNSVVR